MSKSKTIIVMGNGPSLKNVNLEELIGVDTFALNASYRMFRKIDWWPTYHGCFDYVVCENHKEEFQSLMDDKSNNIKKFFYINDFKESTRFQKISLSGDYDPNNPLSTASDFKIFHDRGNSGTNACQVAICLGYKKILLIGVDCNYVEKINEAESFFDGEYNRLEIKRKVNSNPNYWFDDYQLPGDKYNFPMTNLFQKPAWENLAKICQDTDIKIINCNEESKLDCFDKSPLKTELSENLYT